MISVWILVIASYNIGGVTIPMESQAVCESTLNTLREIGYRMPACINTKTGAVIYAK